MTGPSDAELLRAADTDPLAFRALYDRWAQRLLAFCYRRTGGPEVALELVAETFAIASAKRARYRNRAGTVGAWLHGIAANELAAYQRRRRVELRTCQRLAVAVPRMDDTSIERVEEPVDAAGWQTALAARARRAGLAAGCPGTQAPPEAVPTAP